MQSATGPALEEENDTELVVAYRLLAWTGMSCVKVNVKTWTEVVEHRSTGPDGEEEVSYEVVVHEEVEVIVDKAAMAKEAIKKVQEALRCGQTEAQVQQMLESIQQQIDDIGALRGELGAELQGLMDDVTAAFASGGVEGAISALDELYEAFDSIERQMRAIADFDHGRDLYQGSEPHLFAAPPNLDALVNEALVECNYIEEVILENTQNGGEYFAEFVAAVCDAFGGPANIPSEIAEDFIAELETLYDNHEFDGKDATFIATQLVDHVAAKLDLPRPDVSRIGRGGGTELYDRGQAGSLFDLPGFVERNTYFILSESFKPGTFGELSLDDGVANNCLEACLAVTEKHPDRLKVLLVEDPNDDTEHAFCYDTQTGQCFDPTTGSVFDNVDDALQEGRYTRLSVAGQEIGPLDSNAIEAMARGTPPSQLGLPGEIAAYVWADGPDQSEFPTKSEWIEKALEEAGVLPADWDPALGFRANEEILNDVYDLYERLYLEHPELKWAGMAKLAGGAVYGGLDIAENFRLIPAAYDVEVNLLEMNKDIFLDMAWQHVAYAEGGLDALRVAYDRGEISYENLLAWEDIASGEDARMWRGNTWLLRREQSVIVVPGYDRLGASMLTGALTDQLMSVLSTSPVPGGRSFESCVPFGDLSVFEDRWSWVSGDMLQTYRNLPEAERRRLVQLPLSVLAEQDFGVAEASALLPSEEAVTASLDLAIEHLWSVQRPDGLFATPYLSGPIHPAMTSIALNFLGIDDPAFFEEEKLLLLELADQQNLDGGFSLYEGGPPSKALTSLVVLAVKAAMENGNTAIDGDPEAKVVLERLVENAEEFIASDIETEEHPMVVAMENMLWDTVFPGSDRTPPLAVSPVSYESASFILDAENGALVRDNVSVAITHMLPALAILNEHATDPRLEVAIQDWALDKLGLKINDAAIEQQMVGHILQNQDANGGWIYLPYAAALNVMALKQAGLPNEHPAIQGGIDFIRELRAPTETAEMAQIFIATELWDTAVAGNILLLDGVPASDPRLAQSIDRILAEQGADGRWAFAAGAATFPDNDSTAIIMTFLSRAYTSASPEQQPAIAEAVRNAISALVDKQMEDGGWNAWKDTDWSFGDRTPSMLEAMSFDAASADVTGRVLSGFMAAKNAGILGPELSADVDAAFGLALMNLQDTQVALDGWMPTGSSVLPVDLASEGSWWTRWITGYIPSAGFVVPAVRAYGVDPSEPWLQRVRTFLTNHQNLDGGFGEAVLSDEDRTLAGDGPSTPAQTALALTALIAATPDDVDIRHDPVIQKAVSYLLEAQENGTWDNGRPVYTNAPSFDYYDAPFMTHVAVTAALDLYRDALEHGTEVATQNLFAGVEPTGDGDLPVYLPIRLKEGGADGTAESPATPAYPAPIDYTTTVGPQTITMPSVTGLPVELWSDADITAGLDRVVGPAVANLAAARRADGSWRTAYVGGPMHTLVPLIATNMAGADSPEAMREEIQLLQTMMSQMSPEGALSHYAGGEPSAITTSLFVLAASLALDTNTEMSPDFRATLEAQIATSRSFIERFEGPEPASTVGPVHDTLWELYLADGSGDVPPLALSPLSLGVVRSILEDAGTAPVRDNISIGILEILPAMAIMNKSVMDQKDLVQIQVEIARWLGIAGSEEDEAEIVAALEQRILESQDENGGWFLAATSTAFNVIALKELGYDLDDPALARGVDYIRESRVDLNGSLSQIAWRGEVWDTAIMGLALDNDGMTMADPAFAQAVSVLLESQGPDGGFPFAIGANNVPDNDSTAVAVVFLSRALETVEEPELRTEIEEAIANAVPFLLGHQQDDGGWPGYGGTDYSFGSRAPFMMEGILFDASTPDVTARVLGSLVAARDHGAITLAQLEEINAALTTGTDYLQSAQASNGGWWTRWIAGYIPSTAFVLASLRGSGTDMDEPWIQEAVSFIRTSQNEDGGWGEPVEADQDIDLAGNGPSTPLQTALAVYALLAAGGKEAVDDPQVRAGIQYLIEHEQDGHWNDGRPLLTILPSYEYYEGGEMTDATVTMILQGYRQLLEEGDDRALRFLWNR